MKVTKEPLHEVMSSDDEEECEDDLMDEMGEDDLYGDEEMGESEEEDSQPVPNLVPIKDEKKRSKSAPATRWDQQVSSESSEYDSENYGSEYDSSESQINSSALNSEELDSDEG